MAEGLTRETVKAAVESCNDAIHNIDYGVGNLEIADDLQTLANQLAENWETEQSENDIKGLNNAISDLKACIDNIKKDMENVKGDHYTYSETSETHNGTL